MSSVDGYSAFFASAAESSAAALDLTLGIPLDVFEAQIRVGDLLGALVLPPRDGHDLLEILGEQIVAHLPPTVRPGETLLLQVTHLNPNQIVVRNLGAVDPGKPLPAQVLQSPPAAERPQAAPPSMPPPQARPAPLAPPREVFVAASVVRAQPPASASPARTPQPAAAAARVEAVEARITAARAAAPPPVAAPSPPASSAKAAPPERPVPVPVLPAARFTPARTPVPAKAGSPEHLLQTLRVPQSSIALAAARAASDAVRRLPDVLARLERALEPVAGDPRTATLRTLSAFVARIDPRNEQTLPHQIASYVSHVLEGAEKKLVSFVRAQRPGPEPAVVSQAKVLERGAALEHDAKSLVLSLISRPPAQHTPQLAQALRDAAAALSGAQMQTLQQNLQTPGALSFALPVFFHDGGQPAQIRIRRDAPDAKRPLDGDNFHVAFVLDTSSLGTVAVELQSSGRSVSVNVRTQNERHVSAFKSTLADLVGRLERLRYRVSRTTAGVAPPAAPAEAAQHSQPPHRRPGIWDTRA